MDNPFADPSVVEATRAAANAPIEEDNPFAEAVGMLKLIWLMLTGDIPCVHDFVPMIK